MTDWIIQTSFLGDAVLTLPLVHRILSDASRPGAKLKIIAAPRNQEVFKRALGAGLLKWADRIETTVWDKQTTRNPLQLLKWARSQITGDTPERVYCVQRSFSTALLALFSGAKHRVGFSAGAANFLYTNVVPREWESDKHEIEKNLDLLRAFHPVDIWSPKEAQSLLGQRCPQKDVIAFSLSSPWATKIWNLSQAESLMKKLLREGREIWILGDKNFTESARELELHLESKLVKNYVGRTSIPEWLDLISQAEVLVSGDSAAVHVANDLGVPTVALFGPTVPSFGFAPWRRNSLALGVDLSCRPCDIHGPKRCPLGHHHCMKHLEHASVAAAINQVASDSL